MPFTLLGETYSAIKPFFGTAGYTGTLICTGFVYAYLDTKGSVIYVGRTHQFLHKRHTQHITACSTAFDRSVTRCDVDDSEVRDDRKVEELGLCPTSDYTVELLSTCTYKNEITCPDEATRALKQLNNMLTRVEREAIQKYNPPLNIQDAGASCSRNVRRKPNIPVKKLSKESLADLSDILA